MDYTPKYIKQLFTQNSPNSLMVLFGAALCSFFLAQFVGAVLAFVLLGFDQDLLKVLFEDPQSDPANRMILMAVQGANSVMMFIGTPLLYLKFYEKTKPFDAFKTFGGKSLVLMLVLTLFIVLLYMPLSAFIIQWNENIVFPEWMSGFAERAREMEDKVKELTMFLIQFESTTDFLIGLFVVAVLPGIGEELLFRGVLQNKLRSFTNNSHIAIWISAILFSAFHFQFFGFVPRMLLGALFGYLYIWSGTLWVPIFAHFCNNGITLLVFYLSKKEMVDIDQQAENANIWWALTSFWLVIGLLYYFKTQLIGGFGTKEKNSV
ncbi:CPBP family intramembrane glutamic endopeptidase [Flammeovirgaceae bacterium SG7u.111]|nr:CPBP family intramembrane glutamic endopeptidase [Flammeovirgaceae bacterium SG7u.132]WPO35400.1 CPBP family intramembrane glutamic endopeptidase [Flammeovirgaceae bacterium SG7u.111]